MTIFVKLPAGKNGVTRAAVSHATERVFYAANLLALLDSKNDRDQSPAILNVRRKFAARALREAVEMAEIAVTLIDSDIVVPTKI